MKRFTFLGRDHNALSMYIEILLSAHGTEIEIEIVENIEVSSEVSFLPKTLQCKFIPHNEYDFEGNKYFIIGLNSPKGKKAVFDFFYKQYGIDFIQYQTIIHPNTSIAMTAKTGNGAIINPGAVLAPFAEIGKLVSINRNASVGHHTHIDDFSMINPGVNIAGHCQIGKGVSIGMGANIIDRISIGDNAVVGAGALVTKNVEANTIVYGVPAKVIDRK